MSENQETYLPHDDVLYDHILIAHRSFDDFLTERHFLADRSIDTMPPPNQRAEGQFRDL